VSARGTRMAQQPMLRSDPLNSFSIDEKPSAEVSGPCSKPPITYDLPYLATILAEHGGGSVSAELALDLILNEILEQALVASGATGAAIALVRGDEMVCRATAGTNAPDLGVHLDTNSSLSGACIQTADVQICRDTEMDDRVDAQACRHLGVRSILVLPLLDKRILIGIFEILSPRPDAFGERDVQTLRALARRIIQNTKQAAEETILISIPDTEGQISVRHEFTDTKNPDIKPVLQELKMRPVRNVPHRYHDYWTEILGTLVVGLALLLGWMLGRPGWENVPLRELRVRGQEKASPAVQRRRAATQPHKPVEKSVEKSTEQAANGSIAKRSVAAKSTAGGDPAPGALVIYQNGKEIFRMQPVAAEPDQGRLQGAAGRQQALTLGQVTSPALDTASTAEPKFLRVGADVAASRLTRRVEPQYPSQAQEPQIQGPVVLQALISKEGDIRELKLISGDSRLADTAMEAVKQWHYQPYLVNGQPVEVQTDITINFTIP
jgi:TonB family protein